MLVIINYQIIFFVETVNLEVSNTLMAPDFNCSIAVFMASCVPYAAILEASYTSTAPFVKFPT